MKTIRKGVFETNSSSTHSICICTDEELEAWKNNEIFWDGYNNEFIPKEDVLIDATRTEGETDEDLLEELLRNPRKFDVDTYDSWREDYENDHNTYTTKSGETIHILCYYGYNY